MLYQVLTYTTIANYEEKRKPYRSLHFDHVRKYAKSGDLVMGGALGSPAGQALLVFLSDSPRVAENFAKSDPYVLNGMVKEWNVKPWNELVSELDPQKKT